MDDVTTPPRGTVTALISAMRPRQWVKNLLVVMAPAAAGVLGHATVLAHCAVAFVAFCLASSGVYLLNDVRDMVADQGHPRKRHRAVAAGQLSPRVAVPAGVLLLGLGIAATQIDHPNAALATVVALYGANALAYIYVLKTVAVIEMASVAAGFFLRSIAGAAASHLFISTWFFVVVSFGALFLVVGKRLAERHHLGAGASTHRAVLAEYSDNYLNSSLTLIAAVVVTGYCLWAFDTSRTGLSAVDHNVLAIRLTVLPVVLTILHVLRLLERGGGGAPEDLIFDDRTVQVLGVIWAVLIGIGIYS